MTHKTKPIGAAPGGDTLPGFAECYTVEHKVNGVVERIDFTTKYEAIGYAADWNSQNPAGGIRVSALSEIDDWQDIAYRYQIDDYWTCDIKCYFNKTHNRALIVDHGEGNRGVCKTAYDFLVSAGVPGAAGSDDNFIDAINGIIDLPVLRKIFKPSDYPVVSIVEIYHCTRVVLSRHKLSEYDLEMLELI